MFQPFEHLHIISSKNNFKFAHEKSFLMLLSEAKTLGHENDYNTNKPIHSKKAAIHKILSATRKVALTIFIGTFNFYTKYIENFT